MTQPDWLSKIEKLLDDATPGEWKVGTNPNCEGDFRDVLHSPDCGWLSLTESMRGADAVFIAASPDNQRKLISALKIAMEALEKYSKEPEYKEVEENRYLDDDEDGKPIYMKLKTRIRKLGYRTHIAKEALSAIQKIGEEK